ncbi:hypothetical protein [Neobacillus bataviensis]|nr:hypothetical protein [Neobacillus bataviensis]
MPEVIMIPFTFGKKRQLLIMSIFVILMIDIEESFMSQMIGTREKLNGGVKDKHSTAIEDYV